MSDLDHGGRAGALTELRDACGALRGLVDRYGLLAEPDRYPAPWDKWRRTRRLFDLRLRELSSVARPPLAILLGGTNVGKSTVFNLLLGEPVALPCATARGTKSVAVSVPATWRRVFESGQLLPGFAIQQWTEPKQLNLDPVDEAPRMFVHVRDDGPDLAVADTPDIDSIMRRNEAITEQLFLLADAVVYVTNPDKYGDGACNTYLRRAARLGKRAVAVFNRGEPDSEAVRDFVATRLPAAGLNARSTPLLVLPVLAQPDREVLSGRPCREVQALRSLAETIAAGGADLVQSATRGAAAGFAVEFGECLDLLQAEQASCAAFLRRAEDAARRVAEEYEPFLHGPDELDHAVIEILDELKIPWVDVVYDQLDVARRQVASGVRRLLNRYANGRDYLPPTAEEQAAEWQRREREQVLRLRQTYLGRLHEAVREAAPEVRDALGRYLPQSGAAGIGDAVDQYLADLALRRRELTDLVKDEIRTDLTAKAPALKAMKVVTRGAVVALAVSVGDLGTSDLITAPLTDAVTKWVIDHQLGSAQRARLQTMVAARRRQMFIDDFLHPEVLGQVEQALPESHQPGYLEAAREATRRLALAAERR